MPISSYEDMKEKKSQIMCSLYDVAGIVDKLNEMGLAINGTALIDLKKKLESDNFKVLVIGEFKNGKSTFINSLMGEKVLPAYATPCTAVINEVSIKIEEVEGKQVWTYIDNIGREVKYIDGYPIFPPEAKHPVINDIDIGQFSGDRAEDKRVYLEKLQEQYGLTEMPDGYDLHHDSKNGNMQLVKTDWHKEFTHAGGHSLFKEV